MLILIYHVYKLLGKISFFNISSLFCGWIRSNIMLDLLVILLDFKFSNLLYNFCEFFRISKKFLYFFILFDILFPLLRQYSNIPIWNILFSFSV